MIYCKDCGNSKVPERGDVCADCKDTWETMPYAAEALSYIKENDSHCCSGFGQDRKHYFFHGQGWAWQDDCNQVPVEAGVKLFAFYAVTYWTRGNDTTVDSEEYGDPLPYPVIDGDWASWYAKLEDQLCKSPEAALDMDIRSCSECGNHYNVSVEVQCCDPEPDPSVYEQLGEIEPAERG